MPDFASAGRGWRRRSASPWARTASRASRGKRGRCWSVLTWAPVAWERGRPPRMIQVEQLSKYYGARAAIRNLSFRIESGEVVGFLGLNGAGKTTTLRILGGALLPTSGTVRLDGQDLATAPRAAAGAHRLPPRDATALRGDDGGGVPGLRGPAPRPPGGAHRAPGCRRARSGSGLLPLHDEPIATLSHGYRQRVGVAQALVHDPEVLLLDEPANGLDPVQNVEMRALIRSLRGDHTVLVSSHILPGDRPDLRPAPGGAGRRAGGPGQRDRARGAAGAGGGRGARGGRPGRGGGHRPAPPGGRALGDPPPGLGGPHRAPGRRRRRAPARSWPGPRSMRGPQLYRLDVSTDRLESLFLRLTGRRRYRMSAVLLIARRELQGYLRTMTGWIIAAAVLLIDGLLFNAFAMDGARRSAEVLSRFFYFASGPTMVAAIFLSMRLLAEERQLGTLDLLYSSPVRDRDIVLGKFLSALAFLTGLTVLTLYMPLLIGVHGRVSLGHLLRRLPRAHPPRRRVAGAGDAGELAGQEPGGGGHRRGGAFSSRCCLAWLLAGATEPPFSKLLSARGAAQRALPALPVRADPPPRRGVLPRRHLGGALRHHPGARSTAVAMNARSALLTGATVLGLLRGLRRASGCSAPVRGGWSPTWWGCSWSPGAAVLRWSRSALASTAPRARVERTFAVLSTRGRRWRSSPGSPSPTPWPPPAGRSSSRVAPRLATALQLLTALLACRGGGAAGPRRAGLRGDGPRPGGGGGPGPRRGGLGAGRWWRCSPPRSRWAGWPTPATSRWTGASSGPAGSATPPAAWCAG